MIYTVIAYRWGWLNSHFYQVATTQDSARACDIAQEECDDRGGKYGVAVFEWADETTSALYSYCPSTYGEERPHDNQRIEMFRSIGHDAHSIATTGIYWVAPEGKSAMEPLPVPVPRWLTHSVQRHEQMSRFMSDVMEDIYQRRKLGTPHRTEAEQNAWSAATIARSTEDARKLLRLAPKKRRELMSTWHSRPNKGSRELRPPLLGVESGDSGGDGGDGD